MTKLISFLWKNENKKFTRLTAVKTGRLGLLPARLYRENKALFVSVDLIGEKNQVLLEYITICMYVFVPHFYDLSTLVDCWSSVSIRRIIYKFLNVCPFDYTAFVVSVKVSYL